MLPGASPNSVVPSTSGPGVSRDLGPTLQPGSLNARPILQFHDLGGALSFAGPNASFDNLLENIGTANLYTASGNQAEGQSFVSNGGVLTSCQFYLAQLGAPTGTIVAKLYASTGAVGSKVGTGAALATSNTLDISSLIAAYSWRLEAFTFSDGYLMTPGTTYVIVLEYIGGDASNCLIIFGDNAARDSNGNPSVEDNVGNWQVAVFPADVCYYIYSAGGNSITKKTFRPFSAALSFLANFIYPWRKTGTLSFVGAIAKKAQKALVAAALSFVGAIARKTSRTFAAALSFIANFKYPWRQTASLSFVGSAAKQTARSLTTAALSFVGSITKKTVRALTGTLSFVGAIANKTIRALTGALSFVGAIAKQAQKALVAATLSFVGAIARKTSRSFAATLSFIANFKYPWRATAALSFSGSISKNARRAFNAALSFIGSCVRSIARALSATLSFAGSLTKSTARSLAGALSFIGAIAKRTSRTFAATLSFVGALAELLIHGSNQFSQSLSASLAFVGSISKQPKKALSGLLSFVASVAKKTSRSISGVLSFLGNFVYPWRAAAALSFSGVLAKSTLKAFAGALSFLGASVEALVAGVSILWTQIIGSALRGLLSSGEFNGIRTGSTLVVERVTDEFSGTLTSSQLEAISTETIP